MRNGNSNNADSDSTLERFKAWIFFTDKLQKSSSQKQTKKQSHSKLDFNIDAIT